MEKQAQKDKVSPQQVRKKFDETLARNIERVIGTSKAVGDVPLTLATVSSLVLLAEREGEIEAFPSDALERYTKKTFREDLAEIGLDSYGDIKTAIHDMGQKGYIDIDPEGRFRARKPAVTMAKLLDQAFPGMPGMNLVAYLVQTMDEVFSGRKDIEWAINQFDQALQLHSAVLKKEAPGPAGPTDKDTTPRQDTRAKAATLSELLRARQAARSGQASPKPVGGSAVLSATGEEVQYVVVKEELFRRQDIPGMPPLVPAEGEQLEEAEEVSTAEVPETLSQPEPDQQDLSETQAPIDEVSEEVSSESQAPPETETAPEEVQTDQEEEVIPEPPEELTEDTIESRIAALEQDLAMSCPLCPNGKVQEQQTAKGKSFYVCSNKECIFVSWGKPYHLACPWCKNPYLVESTDNEGNTMLSCPRATCRFRQKPPRETAQDPKEGVPPPFRQPLPSPPIPRKPRKKVVRRRRVRRQR